MNDQTRSYCVLDTYEALVEAAETYHLSTYNWTTLRILVKAMRNSEFFRLFDKQGHEFVVYSVLNEKAGSGRAILTGIVEDTERGPVSSFVEGSIWSVDATLAYGMENIPCSKSADSKTM